MNKPAGVRQTRCPWCGTDPQYQRYHDEVWGRPVHDARELFEKLCLDGQQAGLSWLTILRKTESYRAAYCNFEPGKIASFDDAKVAALMQNQGIVRNRLKIQSIIKNARAYLAMKERGIFFNEFLWAYVDNKAVQNSWQEPEDVPAQTRTSEQLSKDLKKLGFSFVGPTIVYAFMQAVGMVNDHLVNCPQYEQCVVYH